ncbi:MAG: primosomal replication protein N [Lautropia sp.]|nr:primosomal replication protein N [Lautropia sp.]
MSVPSGYGATAQAMPAIEAEPLFPDNGLNTLVLSACLSERSAMRYTPAGVPVMECKLTHRSIQHEAGLGRQVGFEMGAVAMADLAHQLDSLAPGSLLTVTGFLAPLRKSSRSLLLHLTRIDLN